MLVPAASFPQIVLALHILAVVAAFGVALAYPVIVIWADRLDPRSAPLLHRIRVMVGRSIVNPGLLVVLIAGIYLASHLHQWHEFYVQWGLGVAIVLGGLEGALVIRSEKRMAELADRDISDSPAGHVKWSPEYVSLRTRGHQVSGVMALLVVVTVVLMTLR
jgi:hypothetical protein